jgi:elongation factor 1-beta
MAAFNGYMSSRSYLEGYKLSSADTDMFAKFAGKIPEPTKCPHAYRWYIHTAALSGVRGLTVSPPTAAAPAPAVEASRSVEAPKAAAEAPAKKSDDDDDFDVFGDDDEAEDEAPTESRAEMLARLKKEAEDRTAAKEAKQRTLVAIEIKPWDVEQDLMALWKKCTETIQQDGLKWGQSCTLVDVAFGIQKIQCTFVMGVSNSSDDVIDAILAMEDEVQSCEVTSMNVL